MKTLLVVLFSIVCLASNVQGRRIKREIPKYSLADKKAIVDAHNNKRRSVVPPATNMKSMVWDDELESVAQNWADQCDYKHGHNIPQNSEFQRTKPGQNLFATTRRPVDPTRSLYYWVDEEIPFYTYANNSCVPGEKCGHYTQAVWADSHRLGCAVAECAVKSPFLGYRGVWYYVVCNYYPPGNYIGQKPYRAGATCSECATDDSQNTGECAAGLCPTEYECSRFPENCGRENKCGSTVLACQNGGTPDYDNCRCQCLPQWTGASCQSPKCPVVQQCEQGKPFDYSTCSCQCGKYFSGARCEIPNCRAMGANSLDRYSAWCSDPNNTPKYCDYRLSGTTDLIKYAACPVSCGVLEDFCPGKTCLNGGQLECGSCKCTCPRYFTGQRCESPNISELGKNGADEWFCSTSWFAPWKCSQRFFQDAPEELIQYKYCPNACNII